MPAPLFRLDSDEVRRMQRVLDYGATELRTRLDALSPEVSDPRFGVAQEKAIGDGRSVADRTKDRSEAFGDAATKMEESDAEHGSQLASLNGGPGGKPGAGKDTGKGTDVVAGATAAAGGAGMTSTGGGKGAAGSLFGAGPSAATQATTPGSGVNAPGVADQAGGLGARISDTATKVLSADNAAAQQVRPNTPPMSTPIGTLTNSGAPTTATATPPSSPLSAMAHSVAQATQSPLAQHVATALDGPLLGIDGGPQAHSPQPLPPPQPPQALPQDYQTPQQEPLTPYPGGAMPQEELDQALVEQRNSAGNQQPSDMLYLTPEQMRILAEYLASQSALSNGGSGPAPGGAAGGLPVHDIDFGAVDTSDFAQAVITICEAVVDANIPYAWGGGGLDGPSQGTTDGGYADQCGDYAKVGFDCSGLARFVIYQTTGIELPRVSEAQYSACIPTTSPRVGDLGFPAGGSPGHVVVYVGDGMICEAQQSGTNVMFSDADPSYAWGIVPGGPNDVDMAA